MYNTLKYWSYWPNFNSWLTGFFGIYAKWVRWQQHQRQQWRTIHDCIGSLSFMSNDPIKVLVNFGEPHADKFDYFFNLRNENRFLITKLQWMWADRKVFSSCYTKIYLRYSGFPLVRNDKSPWFFHDISRGFHKFPGIIFYFFNVAYTPFDSLISLVGRDSDLKSTETWFSSFERNCPRPLIHWLRFKE